MSFTERFWNFVDRHEVRRNTFAIAGIGAMAVGGYVAEHQPFTGGPVEAVFGLGLVVLGAEGLMGAGMQQMEVLAEQREQNRQANIEAMNAAEQQ